MMPCLQSPVAHIAAKTKSRADRTSLVKSSADRIPLCTNITTTQRWQCRWLCTRADAPSCSRTSASAGMNVYANNHPVMSCTIMTVLDGHCPLVRKLVKVAYPVYCSSHSSKLMPCSDSTIWREPVMPSTLTSMLYSAPRACMEGEKSSTSTSHIHNNIQNPHINIVLCTQSLHETPICSTSNLHIHSNNQKAFQLMVTSTLHMIGYYADCSGARMYSLCRSGSRTVLFLLNQIAILA